MSAFIPPTPEPPEPKIEVSDAERLLRLNAFFGGVQDIPNAMGEMWREFVHAYNEYLSAHHAGFTTESEDVRMGNLLDAHLACWEWLRAGERP